MGKLVRRLERKRKTRLRNTPFTDEWSAAQRKKKMRTSKKTELIDPERFLKDVAHMYPTQFRKTKVWRRTLSSRVMLRDSGNRKVYRFPNGLYTWRK